MTNRLQKIEKAINSMSDDRFVYANEYWHHGVLTIRL